MNFDGIWTPVVTPFGPDGEIDFNAFGGLLEHLLARNVHGLIVGGTTGEYYALSAQERVASFEFVKNTVGDRLPLMAGINTTTTRESIALGRKAKEIGFDAILLGAPYYAQPTQDELSLHCKAVDDALDMPIMLYNFPARTGVEMSRAFLESLRESKNFCAIKESTGSIERLHMLATEFSDQLQVSCGMDDQVLEFFLWGARSWVAGPSNFLPEEHVALYQACVVERDFERGLVLAKRLLPILSLLEQGGKFCQYVKYGCALAGIPVGETRLPLQPLTEQERRSFEAAYERLISFRS